jgi:hypothetical protein
MKLKQLSNLIQKSSNKNGTNNNSKKKLWEIVGDKLLSTQPILQLEIESPLALNHKIIREGKNG